jgi:hypothetical protein
MTHLDGNSAPDDLFTRDLSAADATCASCGASGPVATVMVYESAGTVLRCPACDAVLMRVVQHGTSTCVEMRGVRLLRWQG